MFYELCWTLILAVQAKRLFLLKLYFKKGQARKRPKIGKFSYSHHHRQFMKFQKKSTNCRKKEQKSGSEPTILTEIQQNRRQTYEERSTNLISSRSKHFNWNWYFQFQVEVSKLNGIRDESIRRKCSMNSFEHWFWWNKQKSCFHWNCNSIKVKRWKRQISKVQLK